MTLRIRQIVVAARDLDGAVDDLTHVLGVQVAYRDPNVAEFGLHNALMPIGDQFLEVVSPFKPDTTAGRLLNRRGDTGYMVILQTDDIDRDRVRFELFGVRIVWTSAYDDIRAVHLHPKDIGGAIVSVDQPIPPESWRWAGPEWRKYVTPTGAQRVLSIEVEAHKPDIMAARWAEVMGLYAAVRSENGWRLALTEGFIDFVEAGSRGEGVSAFTLAVPAPNAVLARARSRALPVTGNAATICGTQFRFEPASEMSPPP